MVIPKLLNWQRASFYIHLFQGTRSRNPYQRRRAPCRRLAERAGDFSQARTNTAVTIYDPLNGLPFAGNVIPASRFNSAAAGLLQYIPLPTYSGIVQNYRLVASTPNNNNNLGVRLNAPLSQQGPAHVQRAVSESRFAKRAALRLPRLRHRHRPERRRRAGATASRRASTTAPT